MEQKAEPDEMRGVDWLGWAQLAATLVAGLWTAMLFFQYERIQKKLDETKSEIEITKGTLEIEKVRRDISKQRARPISVTGDIEVTISRTKKGIADEFATDLHYKIKNESNEKVNIGEVIIYALKLEHIQLGKATAALIPEVDVSMEDAPWKKVDARAFTFDAQADWVDSRPQVEGLIGEKIVGYPSGGGTGPLEIGESRSSSVTVISRPGAFDTIGFLVRVRIDFLYPDSGTGKGNNDSRYDMLRIYSGFNTVTPR